jgi:hypothetical protein
MKDSGSTDDLASGNESGTEEKTSDHKVWVGEKDGTETGILHK